MEQTHDTNPPNRPERTLSLPSQVDYVPETRLGDGADAPLEPLPVVAPSVQRHLVPGYEILEELGRGGMGVVYKARQIKADRLVALKMILSGDHAGARDRSRFQTEAEAVARLSHPHIIQVYEVGEHQGLPFFSMDFCSGGSLEQRLRGTPLPPLQAAALVEHLAGAIEHAHQQGIIHRDLKPANILLQKGAHADGKCAEKPPERKSSSSVYSAVTEVLSSANLLPKITDFGLAKKVGSAEGLTRTGAIMGTPSYMAPEQAQGKTAEVGGQSDVYALGAILYECLTGRPPFRAPTPVETILEVLHTEPVPPRQLSVGVPHDLETICLKCLAKRPERRYAGAAALADDLARFRRGEPILARPVGSCERAYRWCQRNRLVAGLLALVALSLVTGTLVATYFAIEASANADQARKNEDQAMRSAAQLKAAMALADRKAYTSHVHMAARALLEGQPNHVRELLLMQAPEPTDGPVPPPRGPNDLRGFEWYCLWQQINSPAQSFRTDFWISPAGHRLVWDKDGVLAVADRDSGKVRHPLAGARGPIPLHALAFSGDGRRLAVGMRSASREPVWTVRVYNLDTGAEVGRIEPAHVAGLALDFSGALLAVAGGNRLLVWDVKAGKQRFVVDVPAPHAGLAFTKDGRTIWHCSGGINDRAYRALPVDVALGVVGEAVPLDHHGRTPDMALSPDGRLLALPGSDGQVHIWGLTGADRGREVLALDGHRGEVKSVDFNANGSLLVSVGEDRVVRLWDMGSGVELTSRVGGHDQSIYHIHFQNDGQHVASVGRDGVRVWQATGSAAWLLRQRPVDGLRAVSVAYNPDGKLAVVARAKGVPERTRAQERAGLPLVLLDPVTGNLVRSLEVPWAEVEVVAWSPDGRWLAASDGHELALFDADTGRKVQDLTPSGSRWSVRDLAFHPGAKVLAAAGELGVDPGKLPLGVRTWSIPDGKAGRPLVWRGGLEALAWRPDGLHLAARSSHRSGENAANAVVAWDMASGERIFQKAFVAGEDSRGPFGLAYSPDGHWLAGGGDGSSVVMWDSRDGYKEGPCLKGHTGPVVAVTFGLSDGMTAGRVFSSGEDGTLRIWDLDLVQEVLWMPLPRLNPGDKRWPGLPSAGDSLLVRPDGHALLWLGPSGMRKWLAAEKPER